MNNVTLFHGDCLELMKDIPDNSITCTVTSPPYDNLRTYNGNIDQWCFEKFQNIAKELYRVTKEHGVVVWVVNDETINGSETGSSFKQTLYFKEIGFNLHDTMIWQKPTVPYDPKCNRYWQTFEYMFVLSKGKPICNYIMETCKCAGVFKSGDYGQKRPDGSLRTDRHDAQRTIKETKVKSNIWQYTNNSAVKGHPAQFPLQLAYDHIISWSNEGDTILDCFMGSGTTGIASINANRNFIGIELDDNYFKLAEQRIKLLDDYNCFSNMSKESNLPMGRKKLF